MKQPKVLVIDGQGGRMGRGIVEQLKKRFPSLPLTAIGTNSIATAAMLKAGADQGATGENPVVVNSRNADLIIGPIGMAAAVGKSPACKIFIPVSHRCSHTIVGCEELPLSEYIRLVCEQVEEILREREENLPL